MNLASPSYPARALHLTALWAYGVSQPVFSLLSSNEELLVVREISRVELVGIGVLLTTLVPLLALLCERVVAAISPPVANALHIAFVWLLLIPIALQVTKLVGPADIDSTKLVVWVLAIAGAAGYACFRWCRLFLSYSIVLPIAGAASFMIGAPAAVESARADPVQLTTRPSIVVIVFDELPASSLMDRDGNIDAVRYPHFGRLAREGTWYPSTSTVSAFTTSAVPAILTGTIPADGDLPTLADHPGNLFTLLGPSYKLHVTEFLPLCPREYCPRRREPTPQRIAGLATDAAVGYLHRIVPTQLGTNLPDIRGRWFDFFERAKEFSGREEVELGQLVKGDSAGSLQFVHLPLPHHPWRYMPSGRHYSPTDTDGMAVDLPTKDPWLLQQGLQRHLLQVGYADAILGALLDHLDQTGLYERTLLVVVADHGASFRLGSALREVDDRNVADIAAVPLFIKYPNQHSAVVDRRDALTIDIVPTIADVLGIELPWNVDGVSLLSPSAHRSMITVTGRERRVRAALEAIRRGAVATARRNAALFGTGDDSLFDIGTHKELLGSSAPRSNCSRDSRVRLDQTVSGETAHARSFVATHVSGIVVDRALDSSIELAVAVSGTVEALTRSFMDDGVQRFRAMLSEDAIRRAANRVDVYKVETTGQNTTLVCLGSSRLPSS